MSESFIFPNFCNKGFFFSLLIDYSVIIYIYFFHHCVKCFSPPPPPQCCLLSPVWSTSVLVGDGIKNRLEESGDVVQLLFQNFTLPPSDIIKFPHPQFPSLHSAFTFTGQVMVC